MKKSGPPTFTNRRASFEYELMDRYEAGISLQGTEIKSVREGKVSLNEAYGRVKRGELWLLNLDIQPYKNAGYVTHEPKRARKLLLHRRQITKIETALNQRGLTIIPTRMYWKQSLVKIEIAVAKGRKRYDKREAIQKREVERRLRRLK